MSRHIYNPYQANSALGQSIAGLGAAIFGARQSPNALALQQQETQLLQARTDASEASARRDNAALLAGRNIADIIGGDREAEATLLAPSAQPNFQGPLLPATSDKFAAARDTRANFNRDIIGAGAPLIGDQSDIGRMLRQFVGFDPQSSDNDIFRANAALGNIPNTSSVASIPGQTSLLDANRDRTIAINAAKPGGKQSALSEKIEEIMLTYGVDRRTAVGVATGAVSASPDRTYGGVNITDRVLRENQYIPPPSAERPDAPVGGATSVQPGVDYSLGTGGSGFFGWGLNTVSDGIGGRLLAPETEDAIQGLTNLQIRTQTALQAIVPGRPSQYLLERLDRLAVNPASLMMGDRRSFKRATQTQAMIREEVERMDRDILAYPGEFSRKDMADTRLNKSQMQSILRNYDVVVGSFAKALGEEDPTPQQQDGGAGGSPSEGATPIGTIESGYRFMGGDDTEEDNWELVQ